MLAPAPDWYAVGTKKKPAPVTDPYTIQDTTAWNAPPPIDFATAGSAPGKITLPGRDPDYKSLIAGDPNMVQGAAELDMTEAQLAQARQAAIRQAVIRSGFTPAQAQSDIDEATRQAALANQFSTKAELDRSKGQANTDLQAQLAARGILGSGALTGGTDRIQQNYERGTSQGLNSLLDSISGVEAQTAQQRYQVMQQRQALREQAAQRIAADPRYQPLAPTDAVLDPGSGLYVTPDGRWYTRDGQSAAPPVQSSAPPPPAAGAVPGPSSESSPYSWGYGGKQ